MPFLELDGTQIYYEKAGSGKPFIILPGFLFDSRAYARLIDLLSRHYAVYIIDTPGHGRSGRLRVETISEMTNILLLFTKSLVIINPIICANSGSAMPAMEYASRHKVRELLLVDPSGAKCQDSLMQLLFIILIIQPIALFRRYGPSGSLAVIRIGLLNLLRNLFNVHFWKLLTASYNKDYTAVMRKIKCPVKLVWGNDDLLYPITNVNTFTSNFLHAKVYPVQGDHNWLVFNPRQILPALRISA